VTAWHCRELTVETNPAHNLLPRVLPQL
jgi:hypothetical protein